MALTTLNSVKTHLGISDGSEDAALAQFISEADAVIKTEVGGNIEQAIYTEFYSGDGGRALVLRQRPVQSITSIHVDNRGFFGEGSGAFSAESLLAAGEDYALQRDHGSDTEQSHSGIVLRIGGAGAVPRPLGPGRAAGDRKYQSCLRRGVCSAAGRPGAGGQQSCGHPAAHRCDGGADSQRTARLLQLQPGRRRLRRPATGRHSRYPGPLQAMGMVMIDPRQIQHKHRLMPAAQTASYYAALGGGSFAAPIAVAGAERRPLTVEEKQIAGAALGEEWRNWHVWKANLAGVQPAVGDKLVDADGVAWYVRDVMLELLDERFKLACVKEV